MDRPHGVTLFLCGDVMTGRGVDQILPHPVDPDLNETYVRDARKYVTLAEAAGGPIAAPVDYAWPWGAALQVLDEAAPDVRLVNLETTITEDGWFAPGKPVCYRMSPANVPCVAAARPDACVLANNHVLDFGEQGLVDTLDTLDAVGLRYVGAGRNAQEAGTPLAVPATDGARVLVLACATPSAGVPTEWAATGARPGVAVLPRLTEAAADTIAEQLLDGAGRSDLAVVSVHWGSNWGYEVPEEQVRFARRLIDAGVNLVHGHSSHHPRPIEVYRGRPILYGCGDFVNDYEGIRGHRQYRDDLRLMYLPTIDPGTGDTVSLQLVVLRAERMRLQHASPDDVEWMRGTLEAVSTGFDTPFSTAPEGVVAVAMGH